ncbi:MAG: hypothetical protein Q7S33_02010 [Nanoarchaeota archaeon]|nr:hypothetical protein [Nanoarchaeota archaeon]
MNLEFRLWAVKKELLPSRKINIKEHGNKDPKNQKWGYCVIDSKNTKCFVSCTSFIDNHYLLIEMDSLSNNPLYFGIVDADKIEEADKRLYQRAREYAEIKAEKEKVEIQDLTKYAK